MSSHATAPTSVWTPGPNLPAFSQQQLLATIPRFREPAHVLREGKSGRIGIGLEGRIHFENGTVTEQTNGQPAYPWLATMPALYPEWLGDRSFLEVHQVRFPYVAGAMANGIATSRMVIAMAQAGMLGFFGSAGLAIDRVEKALDEIEAALGPNDGSWGSNLIHSPNEPQLEEAVVDLYLRRGVRRVSASAFMKLTPMVVHYTSSGLSVDPNGRLHRRNHLFAKISRPEVARRFMAPAPADMLHALVDQGKLTAEEARLAAMLPVAEDFTVEADSGGHTDNQTLTALFPTILDLRDKMVANEGYERPIRIGAAGGLGTPSAVAAAFSLGAAYVLTGSINQSAVESGLSDDGKALLAKADLADVVMAPAADMFELGVEVQVLKRGTMFGVRAARLYELYRAYDSLEAIPTDVVKRLEKEMFQASIEDVWEGTKRFFAHADPKQIEIAEADPKHRMALVFRSYLGQ